MLYGEHNSHLRHLERLLNIEISDRGNVLSLDGNADHVHIGEVALKRLWDSVKKDHDIGIPEVDAALRFAKSGQAVHSNGNGNSKADSHSRSLIQFKKKTLTPRTPNQAVYIDSLRKNEMVFGVGPAGTGKTYLAVAMAVDMYERQEVERMIFCRPAVEAGEKLGFLPGDMREKIDPYLRPIYDALYDFLGTERVEKMLERNEIEIAPLAFMRGRTLSNAFVVLDEAQNTTSAQMKMFLSRMGENTRMVITGDPSQVDLLQGQTSGLKEAINILGDIDEIAFIQFTNQDVVRHRLVGKILQAYDDA